MQGIWDFVTSWTFMIIMAVLLIALIGLFFFLRNRQSED
jgi:LPXTG-motif cell wall-anchored protein